MKRLLTVLSLGITIALGQTITPIADIQYVADPATDDASPLDGTTVTISGVVTAEFWGSYKNRTMFVQDADTAWSGIMVFNYSDNGIADVPVTFDAGVGRTVLAEGDSVTVTGTVDEYNNLTQLGDITSLVVHGYAVNPPAPMVVTTLAADAEKYEGCLIKVVDVDVSDPDVGYGEWTVTDGSGDLQMGEDEDLWGYYYWPTASDSLDSITGVLTYSYGNYLLAPRIAMDIVETGALTRVQSIQQVRGSALMMLPDSLDFDTSYFLGDTVSCLAIVTVPDRELSGWDTTGGVLSGYSRFIWQDPNGGPYSSILSYFADATAFPEVFVGDSISITGYIYEYHGAGLAAQFTEMFITEPVSILAANAHHPDTSVVTTGELRNPITAEQYENNIIRIENAIVIDNNLPNMEYSIDDGSGVILSDADATNSMEGYDVYGNPLPEGGFVRPPNGTTIKSITGYCYHAYGSFANNDTYQIRPYTPSDVILGGGPPSITDFTILESALGPADAVTVSTTITDKSDVASAVVTYRVDGGAWTEVAMTEGTDSLWTGIIPATTIEGAFVDYFIKALDDGEDNQDAPMSTFLPPDTSKGLYGYHTRAAGPSILDIQTTPFAGGDSYYVGQVVTASGIVTRSASAGTDFSIQSEATAGYGIVCNDTSGYVPTRGDNVTVKGMVREQYGSTNIRYIQEVVVNSTGNAEVPLTVTGADLAANPESYEGNLVTLGEVTVTAINTYDWTVNDGSGGFLIDDDWTIYHGPADDSLGALVVDDVIASITGVWNFSYDSYKVQIRDLDDMPEVVTGIADGNGLPLQFSLSQNYPNPFNPTTTIEYTLARQVKHTLKVYNLRGALVATLVNDVHPAGSYSVTWNARDFASGMYFLRLDAADFHMTKKLILLK